MAGLGRPCTVAAAHARRQVAIGPRLRGLLPPAACWSRHLPRGCQCARRPHTSSAHADDKVAAARVAVGARQPVADAWDSSRAVYRPAVIKSISDRLAGRWRGQPIDLNHSHEMWAERDASWRHVRHVAETWRSETLRRLLYPDLFLSASISSAVVAHNLWVALPGHIRLPL
jgi:hypothetical protein